MLRDKWEWNPARECPELLKGSGTGSGKRQEELKVRGCGTQEGDQLEMPEGLGGVSSPAFLGYCVSNVSEPLCTHLLTGDPGQGLGICITSSL